MRAQNIIKIIVVVLNLPWSLVGVCGSILSSPKRMRVSKEPPAIIFYVRSFWWYRLLPGMKGVRAMTNGHIVQLSKSADELDLKHELIHVAQHMRTPLIHPIFYLFETIRHGSGPKNKYEKEAYEKAGNRYFSFL